MHKLRAWLIYNAFEAKRNAGYIDIFFDECQKRNIALTLIIEEDINDNLLKSVKTNVDFIIMRAINPQLSHYFESVGVPVFNNAKVSEICNDKIKTYQYASSLGVKVPESLYIEDISQVPSYTDLSSPFVIKPADGKGGDGVFLIHNEDEYQAALDKLANRRLIIQKPSSDLGKDLRVYVIGDEIIASILRVSDTDFRSNFCLGGKAVLYDLSDDEKTMIQQIISGFDFGFVGIDFLIHNGKLLFNEIEDVVGSRMIFAKTSINPVAKYLDYMIDYISINR